MQALARRKLPKRPASSQALNDLKSQVLPPFPRDDSGKEIA
jgi:hypothetical protein